MLLKYLRNLIVSVFCTLFLLRYIPQMGHADILTASGVISTVSGILFGFILATISIFSAASENSNGIIKALKKQQHTSSYYCKSINRRCIFNYGMRYCFDSNVCQ
ncbi:hypothetical protein K2E55_004368 [Shigella dysenteriae]|nr:hypothetical protein [Shigella dysenteriae]EHX5641322.1 hypothetical protein [Shigella dysenteriae]